MSKPVRASARVEARITALTHEGRGVAHIGGKVTFVADALPGERVLMRYTRRHARRDEACALEVLEPSPARVTPRCPHFGVCGGCSLQHLGHEHQITHKSSTLLALLAQFGGVAPEQVLDPLVADAWGYRRRARFKVRHVEKKGGVLVGFTERDRPWVTDMHRCEVLDPRVGLLIDPLRELASQLSVRDRMPQIEVAIGDAAVALVLRHLAPLTEEDAMLLRAFSERHDVQIHVQPQGEDSVAPLYPADPPPLAYRVDGGQVEIRFAPTEFTQVNAGINTRLVERVLTLLAPEPEDAVLDLFCGLGNFSLPLARRAREVLGVEGDTRLVAHARENAVRNGLANVSYERVDLAEPTAVARIDSGHYDLALIDPPRSGAEAVATALALESCRRLVYVSCNPATLARDAGLLVRDRGYRLRAAGIVDMFPHTAHTECVAMFERA